MEEFLVDTGSQYLMIWVLKYFFFQFYFFPQENLFFSTGKKNNKKIEHGKQSATNCNGPGEISNWKKKKKQKNMTKGRNAQ